MYHFRCNILCLHDCSMNRFGIKFLEWKQPLLYILFKMVRLIYITEKGRPIDTTID